MCDSILQGSVCNLFNLLGTVVKAKGKVQYLLYHFLHETDSRPEALHNLGSGS